MDRRILPFFSTPSRLSVVAEETEQEVASETVGQSSEDILSTIYLRFSLLCEHSKVLNIVSQMLLELPFENLENISLNSSFLAFSKLHPDLFSTFLIQANVLFHQYSIMPHSPESAIGDQEAYVKDQTELLNMHATMIVGYLLKDATQNYTHMLDACFRFLEQLPQPPSSELKGKRPRNENSENIITILKCVLNNLSHQMQIFNAASYVLLMLDKLNAGFDLDRTSYFQFLSANFFHLYPHEYNRFINQRDQLLNRHSEKAKPPALEVQDSEVCRKEGNELITTHARIIAGSLIRDITQDAQTLNPNPRFFKQPPQSGTSEPVAKRPRLGKGST